MTDPAAPAALDALVAQAQTALRANDSGAALAAARAALRIDPDHDPALEAAWRASMLAGRWDWALVVGERWCRVHPQELGAWQACLVPQLPLHRSDTFGPTLASARQAVGPQPVLTTLEALFLALTGDDALSRAAASQVPEATLSACASALFGASLAGLLAAAAAAGLPAVRTASGRRLGRAQPLVRNAAHTPHAAAAALATASFCLADLCRNRRHADRAGRPHGRALAGCRPGAQRPARAAVGRAPVALPRRARHHGDDGRRAALSGPRPFRALRPRLRGRPRRGAARVAGAGLRCAARPAARRRPGGRRHRRRRHRCADRDARLGDGLGRARLPRQRRAGDHSPPEQLWQHRRAGALPHRRRQFCREHAGGARSRDPHDRQLLHLQRQPGGPDHAARHGLAEDALVVAAFNAAFNAAYKIGPELAEVWARLLQQVPEAVLWLHLTHPRQAVERAPCFAERGAAPQRLVFAANAPHPEHLARSALADLYLDAWDYNGHTSLLDALHAGVPVVTREGSRISQRMGANLLRQHGAPDWIAHSEAECEQLALNLMQSADKRQAYRAQLAESRAGFAPFELAAQARRFDAAISAAYERYRRGLPPADITID